VLNDVDFQLVIAPYQRERDTDKTTGIFEQKSGFGDVTPRAKVNLVGNDGGFFALALIPYVKLPTNHDHMGNNSLEGGVGIPYSFDVPNWDVGFQTGVGFERNGIGSAYHAAFANSVSIGHTVSGKLSASAEFFSSVSTEQGQGWVGTVDTWLTYQLSKNLRLDAGVYIGVTPAADNLHPWVGMTWRY